MEWPRGDGSERNGSQPRGSLTYDVVFDMVITVLG